MLAITELVAGVSGLKFALKVSLWKARLLVRKPIQTSAYNAPGKQADLCIGARILQPTNARPLPLVVILEMRAPPLLE